MTQLALYGSRYINGVAMHHGEVSRGMFPDYEPIEQLVQAELRLDPVADVF
jgi:glucan phosphorylase